MFDSELRLGEIAQQLHHADVLKIHEMGGTCLGSSRGGWDEEKIVQSLIDHKVRAGSASSAVANNTESVAVFAGQSTLCDWWRWNASVSRIIN